MKSVSFAKFLVPVYVCVCLCVFVCVHGCPAAQNVYPRLKMEEDSVVETVSSPSRKDAPGEISEAESHPPTTTDAELSPLFPSSWLSPCPSPYHPPSNSPPPVSLTASSPSYPPSGNDPSSNPNLATFDFGLSVNSAFPSGYDFGLSNNSTFPSGYDFDPDCSFASVSDAPAPRNPSHLSPLLLDVTTLASPPSYSDFIAHRRLDWFH